MERYLFTLGGKVRCIRCNAKSKRTKQQCMAPAVSGKTKCRTHGGRSTGPRSNEGKSQYAIVKVKHGLETRKIRAERSARLAYLRELEKQAYECGQMDGPKSRGRKPKTVY